MTVDRCLLIEDVPVLLCDAEGPALASLRDITDIMSAALAGNAALVAIPVARLPEDFFRLRTGFAGEVAQKFINYDIRLAVVGDISAWLKESRAFTDFVTEANRGRSLWFVENLDALGDRLGL
jgi:hypothetical protein